MKNPIVVIIGWILALLWLYQYHKRVKSMSGWKPTGESEYRNVMILAMVPPLVEYSDYCKIAVSAGTAFAGIGAATIEGSKAIKKVREDNERVAAEKQKYILSASQIAQQQYLYNQSRLAAQQSSLSGIGINPWAMGLFESQRGLAYTEGEPWMTTQGLSRYYR